LVGIILALPLVFVLPGYALAETLYSKRSLDASIRLLFSLGLSLAIDVVGGFILNIVGLHTLSWALYLGLLTSLLALLAAYQRRRTAGNVAQSLRFRLKLFEYILIGLAAAIVCLSVLYSIAGAQQQHYPGFTQFWMLPTTQPGQSCTVRLGIHSFESTSVTYRVTLTANKTQEMTWSSIVLTPRQEWQQSASVRLDTANSIYVEAQLYRLDKPQSVYRNVHLTLYNTGGRESNTCTSR